MTDEQHGRFFLTIPTDTQKIQDPSTLGEPELIRTREGSVLVVRRLHGPFPKGMSARFGSETVEWNGTRWAHVYPDEYPDG